jgi:SNF2 family DNA or RNA helicase
MAYRKYGELILHEGIWVIKADHACVTVFKQVFPKHVTIHPDTLKVLGPNTQHNYEIFHKALTGVKDSAHVCKEIEWFTKRFPLDINSADLAYIRESIDNLDKAIAEIEQVFAKDYKGVSIDLALPLRDYQKQAVNMFLKTKALLVGDDVGLGKTATSIGPMCLEECRPALVVAQPHLLTQWKNEIERFLPGIKVHILKGVKPYSIPDSDIVVSAYTRLRGWKDILPNKFKYVVFDEIQELRHPNTQKYKASYEIAHTANYRLGLSATPIFNYGGEVYNVLDVLKKQALGTIKDFQTDWCEAYTQIVTDPPALGHHLREKHLMLRRTREDVQKELPVVNRIMHTIEHDEKAMNEASKNAIQLAIDVLTASDKDRGEAALKLDGHLRRATGVAKAKSVAAWVRVLLEAGEKVLLMGWHRDVYDIWMEELKEFAPVMFTGSENPNEKQKSKDAFVEGDSKVLMMSLRSGAGLNDLQTASKYIVFGELDWSPAVHEQAIGRLNRDGSIGPVTSVFLVINDGSDPKMAEILGLKIQQAHGIVNPDQIFGPVTTSIDNRIVQMAEEFLKRHGVVLENGKRTKKKVGKKPKKSSHLTLV